MRIDLRIFRGLVFAAPFSLLMWIFIAAIVAGYLSWENSPAAAKGRV